MNFCPKCQSLLMPKKTGGKLILSCSCGYRDSHSDFKALREEVENDNQVHVIEKDVDPRPIMEAECSRCGNRQAYYHLVQTRASDEPETKFLECIKCRHKWRDYS